MDRMFEYALTYQRPTVVAAARSLLSRVAPALSVPETPFVPAVAAALATASAPAAETAQASAAVPPRPAPVAAGAAESLLQRALAASTSGITIADMRRPDQPLVYVNRAFEQLSGYRSEELLGRNCRFLQGPDTDHDVITRLRTAIAEGREVRETLLNYRGPDRTPWWNEIYMAPVADPDGRIVQYIGVQNDVSAQVAAERALVQERDRAQSYLARIEELAWTDSLTGLLNRRRFEEKVELELWEATAAGGALALLFMDLDGFKAVNDELGHAAGDELLVQVAQRLRSRLRRGDLAARLGGDEFLVCLRQLDPARAAQEAGRVAAALTAAVAAPCEIAGRVVTVTASVGVATFPGDGVEDLRSLMHRADGLMYEAKGARRGA